MRGFNICGGSGMRRRVRPNKLFDTDARVFPCAPHTRRITMKYLLSIVAVGGLFLSSGAYASCQCVCMNEEVRAVCSSTLDIEPICPPRI